MGNPITMPVFYKGTLGDLPQERWEEARKSGDFEAAQPVTDPTGKEGYVPSSKWAEAQKAGYKSRNEFPSERRPGGEAAIGIASALGIPEQTPESIKSMPPRETAKNVISAGFPILQVPEMVRNAVGIPGELYRAAKGAVQLQNRKGLSPEEENEAAYRTGRGIGYVIPSLVPELPEGARAGARGLGAGMEAVSERALRPIRQLARDREGNIIPGAQGPPAKLPYVGVLSPSRLAGGAIGGAAGTAAGSAVGHPYLGMSAGAGVGALAGERAFAGLGRAGGALRRLATPMEAPVTPVGAPPLRRITLPGGTVLEQGPGGQWSSPTSPKPVEPKIVTNAPGSTKPAEAAPAGDQPPVRAQAGQPAKPGLPLMTPEEIKREEVRSNPNIVVGKGSPKQMSNTKRTRRIVAGLPPD